MGCGASAPAAPQDDAASKQESACCDGQPSPSPGEPADDSTAKAGSSGLEAVEESETKTAEQPIVAAAVSTSSLVATPGALSRFQTAPAGRPGGQLVPPCELVRATSAGESLLRAGRHLFTEQTLDRLISTTSRAGGGPKLREDANVDMAANGFGQDAVGELAVGAVPRAELPALAEAGSVPPVCGICKEEPSDYTGPFLVPDRLCAQRACEGAFCRPCLESYYTSMVEGSRYAVPFVRCPTCRGYVRTGSWASCAEPGLKRVMAENAKNLLSLRCIECDSPGSLLVEYQEEEETRQVSLAMAFDSLSDEVRTDLCTWWGRYACGEEEAMEGLMLLAAAVPVPDDDELPEGAAPADLRERVQAMLGAVEDPARRAVLQLAFLRRWPKTWSLCCQKSHCFKCKVGSHHEGSTCEEVQRRMMQEEGETMQFCPGCGVATVKTEGCNHMICICGEEWTWEGQERWVDGGEEEEE